MLGARGLCCSPHTSLMAICGHYSPPMRHGILLKAASAPPASPLWVSPQHLRRRCLLFLLSVAVAADVDSVILPLKQTILTRQYAFSHVRRCLSASKMGEIHTHAKYGLSNGGSSHAVSPHRVYPFHSGSIPCSYSTSLLFSSFSLSLSLWPLTSISAGVWAQLWIRSLWVNP